MLHFNRGNHVDSNTINLLNMLSVEKMPLSHHEEDDPIDRHQSNMSGKQHLSVYMYPANNKQRCVNNRLSIFIDDVTIEPMNMVINTYKITISSLYGVHAMHAITWYASLRRFMNASLDGRTPSLSSSLYTSNNIPKKDYSRTLDITPPVTVYIPFVRIDSPSDVTNIMNGGSIQLILTGFSSFRGKRDGRLKRVINFIGCSTPNIV
jgi:hypothetical protein